MKTDIKQIQEYYLDSGMSEASLEAIGMLYAVVTYTYIITAIATY